jgi:flagellar motility protein MotE (MotC chaperone)
MKRLARWLLVSVLVLDAAVLAAFLAGGLPTEALTAGAGAGTAPGEASQAGESPPGVEALRRLGLELAERAAELDRREAELDELLRGSEVLQRAGLLEQQPEQPEPEPDDTAETERRDAAFQSLQRAYENMEPESAARAIAELAQRDKQVVVELLLGWKPRTSGAILDALTQTDARLSADLSYEIWKLGQPQGG